MDKVEFTPQVAAWILRRFDALPITAGDAADALIVKQALAHFVSPPVEQEVESGENGE